MKFIIFICTRIRHGQYPRLPDFQYSEKLGKYIYQGRELTLEEFNKAAAIVFDQGYRNGGYHFAPLAIEAPACEPIPVDADGNIVEPTEWVEPDPGTVYEVKADPSTEVPETFVETPEIQTEDSGTPEVEIPKPKFILSGKSIFLNGVRVGGLYGEEKHLRVVEEFQDIRTEIETFIQSLSQ